jgi:hypothetical protein
MVKCCEHLNGHIEHEQPGKKQTQCKRCGLWCYPSTQRLCPDFKMLGKFKTPEHSQESAETHKQSDKTAKT